jgi:hypothetical protein
VAASIHFPPEIFTLARHESFAHERFAYAMLRIATPVLNAAQLPINTSIHFDPRPGIAPWGFDVAIGPRISPEGNLDGFQVRCTGLVPAFVLGVCHYFASGLFNQSRLSSWIDDTTAFREHVMSFRAIYAGVATEYRRNGLASALRRFYGEMALGPENLSNLADDFDLCAQFIANHEIAHAYTGQMRLCLGPLGVDDQRAFEYVADLVATEWLYNRMVRGTPDTQAYRFQRGFTDHSASILSNTWSVYRGQILVLLILALASSTSTDGMASLDGGKTHPHSMVRHMVQQVHFITLVQSNQQEHVLEEQLQHMDTYWDRWITLFYTSGLVGKQDLEAVADERQYADLERATYLIEKYDVKELLSAATALRTFPARRST